MTCRFNVIPLETMITTATTQCSQNWRNNSNIEKKWGSGVQSVLCSLLSCWLVLPHLDMPYYVDTTEAYPLLNRNRGGANGAEGGGGGETGGKMAGNKEGNCHWDVK